MTPIVLHHGLMGYTNIHIGPLRWSYFQGIDRAILQRGFPLVVTAVHPTAGVLTRARQLKQCIRENLAKIAPEEKIVILAHSLGGLDARYMLTHLGMARFVKALVTISTPHRGSAFADWCVRHVGQRLGAFRICKILGLDVQAVSDVTCSQCAKFNAATPDMPGVRYYSVTAASAHENMPVWARHSHKLIFDAQGDNDGLVAVTSGIWGEHLGTWPADHWMTINHRVIPQVRTDITNLWMKILDRLVSDGIMQPRT